MSEQKQILETYLKNRFSNKPALTILRLDKIADGWESDNHVLTVEYGEGHRTQEDWVWRIYSGEGSQGKAAREFNSLKKLFAAGYPVPQVFLLEIEHSPVDRPFIIMEYIPGEVMWEMIDSTPSDRRTQLIDQFCQSFAQLHALDWRLFDDNLPADAPFFFIDRWMDGARNAVQKFPKLNLASFLEWVATRRNQFACHCPAPIHHDFHPGNVLVTMDSRAVVIDWTGFDVTDFRFDFAWTLVLAHAYSPWGLRDRILQGYQHHAGKPVEQLEVFEAIACMRRLFSVAVSLTQDALKMGMNAQAAEAMRANMEPHRRIYQLFVQHTGLRIETLYKLFG